MRVIFCILLLLQILQVAGQTDAVKINTAEDAVAIALLNHPTLQTDLERKKLSKDIKSTWFQWLFQINQWKIMQDHLNLLGDVDRIAVLRYQEGDIDLLEKSWFVTELAEIRTNTAILKNEIEITGNLLKQLIDSNEKIMPADTSLSIYQIDKEYGKNLYSQALVDTIHVENLQLELDSYFTRLQFYNTVGLDYAQLILQINHAKFNTEEIDYLEFTRTIAEAYTIKLEYLKTLNSYNQTAIELEHYAY